MGQERDISSWEELQKEDSMKNLAFFGRVPGIDPIYRLNDYAYLTIYHLRKQDHEKATEYALLFRDIIYAETDPERYISDWLTVCQILSVSVDLSTVEKDLQVVKKIVEANKLTKKYY